MAVPVGTSPVGTTAAPVREESTTGCPHKIRSLVCSSNKRLLGWLVCWRLGTEDGDSDVCQTRAAVSGESRLAPMTMAGALS